MGELTKVVNIGDKLEEQLNEIGIFTLEQLKERGSKVAWLEIKATDPSACIMRLSALEGAIQGVRWHFLDEKIKQEIKEFYHNHKN